nr:hypothetical protein [uncultured Capnocytophaga sp.]
MLHTAFTAKKTRLFLPDISIEKNAQCQTNFAKTYKSSYPPQRHLFPICYDTSLFFPALL